MSGVGTRWTWWLLQLSRRIWFRAALFAVLSIASALVAIVLTPLIPPGISSEFGADAVGNILEILASSMLVVATFSLSTMISAYSAASSSTTPRVTELLLQDTEAQNALSTFVGAFLFSLVGIIGLSTGVYGEDGHIILFVLTLVVVLVIVVTFLRWVELLSNFGRIPDAINRTAAAAVEAMTNWVSLPLLGGRPSREAGEMPYSIIAPEMGYVRHIDMERLQDIAECENGNIRVMAIPGAFLDASEVIVKLDFETDEEQQCAITETFDIGNGRTFDQDPAYGISALAEIGIKALSPGINDPVTAIRVIGRLVQVLTTWVESSDKDQPRFDRVFVEPLDPDQLYDNAFAGLAVYGASDLQVSTRLQQAFLSLSRLKDKGCAAAAVRHSARALELAKEALAIDDDFQCVTALAKKVGGG